MIRYDQSATFVDIPIDIVFEQIIVGDDPLGAPTRLQEPCAEWCANNLYGHYGAYQHATGRLTRPNYGVWFELVNDAIHFKMRWY